MKTLFLFTAIMIFAASVAFAQAGPKQNEPAKRDTTKTEEKVEAKKAEPKKDEVKEDKKKKVEPQETKQAKETEANKTETYAPVNGGKAEPTKTAPPKEKKTEATEKKAIKPAKVMEGNMVESVVAPTNHIIRAVFTTAVEAREPVGKVESLTTESGQVCFFTEIVGLEGHTVTHRWSYGGKVLAEVPFAIKGPRWRVYSSKKLIPAWSGRLMVEVVDDEGKVHLTKHLSLLKI
jgi:hypothetical protein